MPVLKTLKNGVWVPVSGISEHTHNKDDIVDFPSSLPADGGNADTLDGKHANDFAEKSYVDSAISAIPTPDVSGYAQKSELPTKVSQLQNDAGYLTEHQDISGKLDASALPTAVNTALAQAKASGEFDGKDGKDGVDGKDGYTPQKNVDYFDGKDGNPGADGVSPTVTVSKSGKVTTVSITDKNGTKTATINDGADGASGSNGKDGTSATHNWNGTTLTITSASGTSSANLKGDKGDTGVPDLETLIFAMGYEQLLQYQEQTGFATNSTFGLYAKYYSNASLMITLEADREYLVLWDDELCICTAYSCSYSGHDFVCVGNGSQIGGQSENRSFLIAYEPAIDRLYVCSYETGTSHKFGVYEKLPGGDGVPGEDGFSPVANVRQTANGAVISITDKSGTTTATIANGKDGLDATPVTPLFANKVSECTDTTKPYVLPDGNIYTYMTMEVTHEVPNCNNLCVPEECMTGCRISSNGSIKNDMGETDWVTGYISVNPSTTYVVRSFPGFLIINEYSDIPASETFGTVPNTFIKRTQPTEYTWESPQGSTKACTLTTAENTKYIRLYITGNENTPGPYECYVTLDEPIDLGTTTKTEYVTEWSDTGHAFVSADYEGRIIALENASADFDARVKNIEDGVAQIPDYWQTALDNGVEAINTALCTAGRNKSAFLFYSDAHWNYGSQMSPTLLKYLHKHTGMTKTFFGGDIVNDEATNYDTMEYLWAWRKQLKDLPNHHSVVGNHDDGNATNNLFSEQYVYGYLLGAEETPDMVMGDGLYYYIDNAVEKTRYICLDTAYKTGTSDQTTMRTFLTNALKGTADGWHIVVVSHIWYMPDYNQYSVRPIPITGLSTEATAVCTVLDNYNARSGEFANCGAKVEFCIGGHVHRDYVGTTGGGIPIVVVETDSKHIRSVLTYTAGTTTEASVNGIVANYDNDTLTVVRVGRGNSFIVDLITGESTEIPDDGGDSGGTTEPTYTNVLDTVGWVEGVRLSGSDGGERDNKNSDGTAITDTSGFIPMTTGQRLYLKNVAWHLNDSGYGGFVSIYYADKTLRTGFYLTDTQLNASDYNMEVDENGYITKVRLNFSDMAFVRIVALNIDENSIITVDEPID